MSNSVSHCQSPRYLAFVSEYGTPIEANPHFVNRDLTQGRYTVWCKAWAMFELSPIFDSAACERAFKAEMTLKPEDYDLWCKGWQAASRHLTMQRMKGFTDDRI